MLFDLKELRDMDTLRSRARNLRNSPTDAERALWRVLRGKQLEGFRFRRQVPVGGYIADFLCPRLKLIVELDGGQHAEQVPYDQARTAALSVLGYRVLRYWNDDVLLQRDAVTDDIHRHLMAMNAASVFDGNGKSTPPQPSPSLREREGVQSNDEGSYE
ncbi:endonuclease domain-containing protein [Lysobacter fragariae]